MRDKKRTNSDYVSMFSGEAYEKKVAICRGAVISFLNNLIHNHGVRTIEWDAKNDVLLLPDIVRYAQFLSKLRGTLMTWKSEERGEYEYSFPIIEEPPRAINALYNFAKGHALIHGRRYLIREDLEIVKSVCFSSMPYDRFRFLQLLAKHEGRITTQQIESELGCSNQTATRTMRIFEALGVVTVKSIQLEYAGVGRPMLFIEINSDFTELLRHAQAQDRNDGENNKIQQTNPARAAHDQIHSHPRKDGNYNLIHQNKPVLEEEYINSTSWDERILIHVPCSICEESPCNELNGKMFCKLHYLIEAIKNE